MLFLINLMLTLMFLFMKHPLSMGMILLMQTIIISLMTGNFCVNFWFSYIIFLIMIGGMLILFIYMTSIASNEKFKMNFKFIFLFSIMFIMLMLNFNNQFNFLLNLNTLTSDMINNNQVLILNFSFVKYTTMPMLLILMFMIIYLFFALIAVVKISNLNMGPLRLMN
uniref:NADH-ubiquinone oxidoreductase chain 6 n=1 Tax=Coleoptera sp. 26 KM-2017 TaxID=2219330 RepID=A0A346RKB2_9COLE|nr:NADH dehydrogenase subunit 6 [Coleoptera sp. 26 KM-2017]